MSEKKQASKPEPEYVVIDHGQTINMYRADVWDNDIFRQLINGKEIGRGMTFSEALAIRKLMERE
jgi:hypothetical protein